MDDNIRKSNLIELQKRSIPLQYELQQVKLEYDYSLDQYRIAQDKVFKERYESAKEREDQIEAELKLIWKDIRSLVVPYRISYVAEIIDGGRTVMETFGEDVFMNHYYPIDTTKQLPTSLEPNLAGLLHEIHGSGPTVLKQVSL
jgi:hypothetical protein